MSNLTTVLGKIEVPQGPQLDNAWELDSAVIGSLPAVDEYPFLCRSMFALNPKIPAYGSRIIHFAAAMKGVEASWPEWVEKLEGLLRRLSWLSVVVHLETESFGDYSFWWVATNPDPPRPVTSWERSDGPWTYAGFETLAGKRSGS